ncbi:MAG: DUF928 domain-containing protein [Synechococcaceae cyanobacterium RL_1_2]|nr:DUF928 domain-containing protein [Synechococcaceae cyanobacterium RL_1_2]
MAQQVAASPFEVTFNSQNPFNTNDSPRQSAGGASRSGGLESQCGGFNKANKLNTMIPITPYTMEKVNLTTESHPNFYVYVPETGAEQAFFSVMGVDNDFEYQTFLDLPAKEGVMQISLPKSLNGIEVGKNYRWSFVMICNQYLEPDSPLVDGQVKRVALAQEPSNDLSGQEKAAIYGQQGLWVDALDNLASFVAAQPDHVQGQATWNQFLSSVGLEAVATTPLITY